MAKLYAELSSDKGGRVASKGGNEEVNVKLMAGNSLVGSIELRRYSDGTTYLRYYEPAGRCVVLNIIENT